MEYGRVLEHRVDEVFEDLASLVPTDHLQVDAWEIVEIERRLADVRRAIYRQPGELIGSDFVGHLDETLVWAHERIAAIRRTP